MMLNITERATDEVCPRCDCSRLNKVHCLNAGCTRHVVVCPRCDKPTAVLAFMTDHAKDCSPVRAYERSELRATG